MSRIIQEKQITLVVEALKQGECVAMPTETVYGLAADALNPHAVAKVFAIKNRPHFDPLIVHVASTHGLDNWVELNDKAWLLIQHFWPGPLTLLLPKKATISDLVTAGHPTVAVRCPAHPLAHKLLASFAGPLVAPSANPFGKMSPTCAQDVDDSLGDKLTFILDGGPCSIGIESTIIDASQSGMDLPVLRLGGIAPERLSELGFTLSYPTPIIGQAPGTLKNHYAPHKPLYLLRTPLPFDEIDLLPTKYSYLTWSQHLSQHTHECLTSQKNSIEAASRLFQSMRILDSSSSVLIIVEPIPPKDLGRAIQDRLQRAASGFVHWDQQNKQFVFE
jgi:L-threonylcarbamoyladenylate synthase